MLITLNKQTKLKLTDIMQDNYSDLDLYREKPIFFENDGLILTIKPVPFREHDIFLKEMASLIFEHYEIFQTIDFLNAYNYQDPDSVNKLMQKIGVFTADKKYGIFRKEARKFVIKWAFISKKKATIKPKHSRSKIKKFLESVEPSEFIYMLFLLFVYNFDIVKKNTIEFLKMFRTNIEIESQVQKSDTSSVGTLRKVVAMPKFSQSPFSKSTLNLLEEQSKR